MKSFEQVKSGFINFLECELMPKISGLNKWIVGAGLSMYLENGVNVFNELKENQFVKTMDIIDAENNIDIDRLYKYIHREAEKSAVTFKTRLLGDITINAHDIERLYSYINAE